MKKSYFSTMIFWKSQEKLSFQFTVRKFERSRNSTLCILSSTSMKIIRSSAYTPRQEEDNEKKRGRRLNQGKFGLLTRGGVSRSSPRETEKKEASQKY